MADVEKAIEEMTRRIVEAVHPDKIILFGSHARGDAGPDSDVDLLIVGPSRIARGVGPASSTRCWRASASPRISSG